MAKKEREYLDKNGYPPVEYLREVAAEYRKSLGIRREDPISSKSKLRTKEVIAQAEQIIKISDLVSRQVREVVNSTNERFDNNKKFWSRGMF